MKKVCGIELKSNEARLVVLEGSLEDYKVIATPYDKLKIEDTKDQSMIKEFHAKVLAFFDDEDFAAIGLKERMTKGRFSGGAMTFKMEALMQTSDYEVRLIHGATIKSKLKNVDYDPDVVKKYQEEAFRVALYLFNN